MEKNSIRCSLKTKFQIFAFFDKFSLTSTTIQLSKSKTRVLQSLVHKYLVFIKAQGALVFMN